MSKNIWDVFAPVYEFAMRLRYVLWITLLMSS